MSTVREISTPVGKILFLWIVWITGPCLLAGSFTYHAVLNNGAVFLLMSEIIMVYGNNNGK